MIYFCCTVNLFISLTFQLTNKISKLLENLILCCDRTFGKCDLWKNQNFCKVRCISKHQLYHCIPKTRRSLPLLIITANFRVVWPSASASVFFFFLLIWCDYGLLVFVCKIMNHFLKRHWFQSDILTVTFDGFSFLYFCVAATYWDSELVIIECIFNAKSYTTTCYFEINTSEMTLNHLTDWVTHLFI